MNPYSSQLFAITILIRYWDPDGGRKRGKTFSPAILNMLRDIFPFPFSFPEFHFLSSYRFLSVSICVRVSLHLSALQTRRLIIQMLSSLPKRELGRRLRALASTSFRVSQKGIHPPRPRFSYIVFFYCSASLSPSAVRLINSQSLSLSFD